jgi:hypothetical protein
MDTAPDRLRIGTMQMGPIAGAHLGKRLRIEHEGTDEPMWNFALHPGKNVT